MEEPIFLMGSQVYPLFSTFPIRLVTILLIGQYDVVVVFTSYIGRSYDHSKFRITCQPQIWMIYR